MKNSVFKSFRINIVICTVISLILTILTEVLLITILSITVAKFRDSIFNLNQEKRQQLVENFMTNQSPKDPGFIIMLISVIIVIGIILFLLYFLLLTNRLTKELYNITTYIKRISTGDFNTKIYIDGYNEFSAIAENLNKMSDNLKRMMENERKSEQTKNELITSVAHDLRTPLTSIIGYLTLITNDKTLDEETKQKYIKIAFNKSRRLENLIENLFSYTKFSFGDIQMQKARIDIIKFIQQLLDEFYPSFQENNLVCDLKTDYNNIYVFADGDFLSRAFGNLIGNSIKYGKNGKKIKLSIGLSEDNVKVSILNYGEVIPEKDIQNIFERFYRVEQSRSSDTGGSGLGLAIAKSIIETHDGTIGVTSDLSGTIFTVVLPISKIDKEEINIDEFEDNNENKNKIKNK